MLIGKRNPRSEQVGALRAAAQIRRMAAGAVGFIQGFAANENVLRREFARELRESTAPASSLPTSLSGLTSATLTSVAPASACRRRLLSRCLSLRRLRRALGKYEGRAAADRQNDRCDQSDVSSHKFRNPPDGSGSCPARALNCRNECHTHERVLRPWAVSGYYDAGARADYRNSMTIINYDEISESLGSVRSPSSPDCGRGTQILRTIRSSP